MNKEYLLYEINMYRRKLDLSITAAEHQLASVKHRLTNLTHDLYTYIAFLVVPMILVAICNIFAETPSRTIAYVVFASIKLVILFIYIITLPINMRNLIKTVILIWLNKESDEPVILPPLEGTCKGSAILKEETYRSEHDKLVRVLSYYYLNQDKLEKLYQKVNSHSCNMTMVELEYELSQLPIYEDIQPANPFTGTMGEQVKAKTNKFMCAIILAILISVLIGIFG